MKKAIALGTALGVLATAATVAILPNDTVLHNTDRMVWVLDGTLGEEETYIIHTDAEMVMCEFCTAPVYKHSLCIEQWGWIKQGGGDGVYVWEPKGEVCLDKQWASSWGFNEVPKLNISGFHEVNIDADKINLTSEYGVIIDGEEAHTIFLPAISK